MVSELSITSEDNIRLAADYFQGNEKGVILLHMLGLDKGSWEQFPEILNKKGYTVIAMDFRGHGNSELNYEAFTDNDWKNLIKDIKAAASELKSNNVKEIYIIGASIGANTAINYAITDNSVEGVALLSPGLDYLGVTIIDSLAKYDKKILLVSSQGDEYSYQSVEQVKSLNPNALVEIYEGDDHGTDMLDNTPLKERLMQWLLEK